MNSVNSAEQSAGCWWHSRTTAARGLDLHLPGSQGPPVVLPLQNAMSAFFFQVDAFTHLTSLALGE